MMRRLLAPAMVMVCNPILSVRSRRPVTSAREAMEIVNAYETVGSYRGAAALCGTTPKTVKRVLERRAAVQVGRRLPPLRARKTAAVTDLITERVRATDGRI